MQGATRGFWRVQRALQLVHEHQSRQISWADRGGSSKATPLSLAKDDSRPFLTSQKETPESIKEEHTSACHAFQNEAPHFALELK